MHTCSCIKWEILQYIYTNKLCDHSTGYNHYETDRDNGTNFITKVTVYEHVPVQQPSCVQQSLSTKAFLQYLPRNYGHIRELASGEREK